MESVAQLNPAAIIVSRRQEGNPVLRHIRNVRWLYGDIIPDYLLGPTTAAIFISLRSAEPLGGALHVRMCLPAKYRHCQLTLMHAHAMTRGPWYACLMALSAGAGSTC